MSVISGIIEIAPRRSGEILNMNDKLNGFSALSDVQDITRGGLFVAGILCAAVIILLVYVLHGKLAHRKCCSEEKLTELNSELGVFDPVTALHSRRVAELARALIQELGLSQVEQRTVWIAAQAHDIGKTAISSEVLCKTGPLNDEEWQIMRSHPEIGAQILEQHGFCSEVARIVRHHHERWDGGGYPAGLVGHQIPLGARVLAVVDGFDAMTNDRPYRPAMRLNEAVYSLRSGSGTQWDPEIVEAFLRIGIPPMYMEGVPPNDSSVATGRAGRRLGASARSLARSSASAYPLAG